MPQIKISSDIPHAFIRLQKRNKIKGYLIAKTFVSGMHIYVMSVNLTLNCIKNT